MVLLAVRLHSYAQSDSTWNSAPSIKVSGYADVFYAYDFNQPESGIRQKFLYNHNRHNQFNLNFGYLKIAALHQKYRANLALHSGTYVADNYSSEPELLKNIFEANAGISLTRKANLWLDAGIFGSHIGFEGAISIDNWTLTRSLLAENSPYYLTGAKLTFKPNQKWEMAALVCNGWQRIQSVRGNSILSAGTQLKWMPNEKSNWNWSTFIGTNDPDSIRRMRYFNNFYGQFQLSAKVGLIAGFDIGFQQSARGSNDYKGWFSPVAIVRYRLSTHWYAAFRAEYYQDKSLIVINSPPANCFQVSGFSLNVDYSPIQAISCRLEGRWLSSAEKIFERKSEPGRNNVALVASMAVKLE